MPQYKEGTYNYKTKTGYSTPEWSITDFSEDLSNYSFKMDVYDRNYAQVKMLKYSIPLEYIDNEVKIPSKIEDDRDGTYHYNIVIEDNDKKYILLSGLKIVENGI